VLTVSRLRSWVPEDLAGAAAGLRSTQGLLVELQRELAQTTGAMRWQGPAAYAARAAAADVAQTVVRLAESYAVQAEVVLRAGRALQSAQDLLVRAQHLAAEHGLTLLEDGSVPAPAPVLLAADAPESVRLRVAHQLDAAREARTRAQAMAREALSSAAEADRDAAAALRAGDPLGALLARLAPGVAGLLSRTAPLEALVRAERGRLLAAVDGRAVPAPGSDPFQVSAWWSSLPAEVQAGVVAVSPELVGNLDGIPARVRDAANRGRLAGERALLEAAADDARDKLRALDEIERVLAPPAQDRYLLVLDSSGEQLKAAVAVGDVDTAAHVAVFTPGFTTTVQDSLRRYDRELAALQVQASQLALQGETGTVAAVAWLGYEAPQWASVWRPSRSVLTAEAAARGAVQLAAFYDGLDAAREVPAHLTALGHSYGSLTTGLALQRGTGVDDAVVFGSPGIGTNDVRDLGLQPGRVFVVEARRDAVADLAAFGIDPNQLHGVTPLSAARDIVDGVERPESVGHSGYLTDRTTSQYAIAAVVAGVPEQAPRRDTRGIGDLLATPVPWAQ
jgi:hypothetical protein